MSKKVKTNLTKNTVITQCLESDYISYLVGDFDTAINNLTERVKELTKDHEWISICFNTKIFRDDYSEFEIIGTRYLTEAEIQEQSQRQKEYEKRESERITKAKLTMYYKLKKELGL